MLGDKSTLWAAVILSIFLFGVNESLAEPIGQIDTVGITWHEEQGGCYNAGPQIAMDSSNGNIYIVWTLTHSWNYWNFGGSGFNCYSQSSGWAYGDTGLDMYPGIYNHENHSILLAGNSGNRDDAEIIFWGNLFNQATMRGWWNDNHFEDMALDTSIAPREYAAACDKSQNGTIHLLAVAAYDWRRLYYGSYTRTPFVFSGWQYVDSVNWGYEISFSPVSTKSAITYFNYNGNNTEDNDIYLTASQDGINWDFQNKTNITNFAQSDPLRPYLRSDIKIDYLDNIHLVFETLGYRLNRACPESTKTGDYMSFIWHWSEAADSFTVAADGWIRDPNAWPPFTMCRYGAVNKPQLGINPSNGYLYLLYERQSLDDYNYARLGNSDLWVTVSTDGGLNWARGINISNTFSPNCNAGDCSSEIEGSLYGVVDDTLHIVYILDKDAGMYQREQGWATQNYVIYQKIPTSLIPTTPLIEQYSIRQGPPRCPYVIGDVNGDSLIDGSDVVYAVSYLKGRGPAPPVGCSCPNTARPFFGAGDVNGNCIFNGMDLTFYVAYLKGRYQRLRFCYDCPPYPRYH